MDVGMHRQTRLQKLEGLKDVFDQVKASLHDSGVNRPTVAAIGVALVREEALAAGGHKQWMAAKIQAMTEAQLESVVEALATNRESVRISSLTQVIFQPEMNNATKLTKTLNQSLDVLDKFVEHMFMRCYLGEKVIEWKNFEKDVQQALKGILRAQGRQEGLAAAAALVVDED